MNNIALGFGDNTDYELIWDTQIIIDLISKFKITKSDIQHKKIINNERDLLIGMLYFLKNNIGGECSVFDTDLLNNFASRFKYNITIGGTCPRAAIAMNILGYKSNLHLVVMNKMLEKLIPKSINYICSNKETNYDIHLIFQYPKGITINVNDIYINTNRENRIIIGNNNTNSVMNLSQEYFDQYVKNSKVLMISGFNTMTNIELLKERLNVVKENIKNLKDTKIFYEDACFISDETNQLCKDILFEYVDIFSFNEDELINYSGRNINLLDPKDVLLGLEELYKKFKVNTIVVHSKYWAISYGKNSIKYHQCLKGGITMATTRFRFGDNFNNRKQYVETYYLKNGKIENEFAKEFNYLAKEKALCVPSVEVNEKDVTTIGLGDSFVGGFVAKLSNI